MCLVPVAATVILLSSCWFSAPEASLPEIPTEVLVAARGDIVHPATSVLVAHVTDIHLYASSHYVEGPSFTSFERNNGGRALFTVPALLEELRVDLVARGVKAMLVSGDQTVFGIPESHREVARVFAQFEADGIEVFVTPGNHDLRHPRAARVLEEGSEWVDSSEPEDFAKIYDAFGYGQAILRDEGSLSYLAELTGDVWLLALDSASYEYNYDYDMSVALGIMRDSQYPFASQAAELARERGKRIIVMTHHNFLEHYEIDEDLSTFMINDDGAMLQQLAADGITLGLSGHIHKNDVKLTTVEGVPFYGVATGSLALYPHTYRVLGLDADQTTITTHELSGRLDPAVVERNRAIYVRRHLERQVLRLEQDYSPRDAVRMAEYFAMVNLYSQLGLEAWLPDKVLRSRGRALYEEHDSWLAGFALALPIDTPPNDRSLSIPHSR